VLPVEAMSTGCGARVDAQGPPPMFRRSEKWLFRHRSIRVSETGELAVMVLTGLLAGAVLGTWLNEVSLRGSSELWIAYPQAVTPAYTRGVPRLEARADRNSGSAGRVLVEPARPATDPWCDRVPARRPGRHRGRALPDQRRDRDVAARRPRSQTGINGSNVGWPPKPSHRHRGRGIRAARCGRDTASGKWACRSRLW
jgi:hypothetical protein